MCGQPHSQSIVRPAQPARCGTAGRHQAGYRLSARLAESLLFGWRERLQIACHLPVIGRNDDQSFVLRAPLDLEQTLYRDAIVRVAAQAVAVFGGIGDQAAASEVRGEASKGGGDTMQSHLSDQHPSPQPIFRLRNKGARQRGRGCLISARSHDGRCRAASGNHRNEWHRRSHKPASAPSSPCRPARSRIILVRRW